MNLENYGIMESDFQEGIPLTELKKKDILLPIVKGYADQLETSSLPVAASLFIKRYAVLTAAASLDYYGLQKGTADWWKNARFNLNNFTLFIHCSAVQDLDGCWMELVFLHHLKPLIAILSKEYRLNETILWENTAVRLNAVFQRKKEHYSLSIIQEQYDSLIAPNPVWLGGMNNPLQQYLHLKTSQKQTTLRKTCCRYYQLNKKEEGMPYCLVCPLQNKLCGACT